jgi:DME family drug/metabolite transporter
MRRQSRRSERNTNPSQFGSHVARAHDGALSTPRTLGLLLIALAAVTWGTTGATLKLVARDSAMSPLLVGFFRVAIAAPALLLAARAAGPIRVPAGGERWRLVAGGVAMGAYQVCYFWGVAKTSVAVGALIAICSAPLFMIGLAALWLGERVSRTTGMALAAGVTGAALLTVGPHGLGSLPAGFLEGVALALGAGLAYAVYAVVVKDLVARLPPLPIAAVTFWVAALVLLPALATERATAGPATWALLAYLGLVPTALAYVCYVVGMRTTPVAASGVLTLIEPLTATLLGVVFFGDRLGSTGAAGALLLLGAVATLAHHSRVR